LKNFLKICPIRMTIKIYKLISNLLIIPIIIFFILRFCIGKENFKSLTQKFSIYKYKIKRKKKLVWINAVSIGESKVGITIADKIKSKYPNYDVLLTTSTISSYKLLISMNLNLTVIYAPIDISIIVNRFIDLWKPSIAIFVESEIWPSTFSILKDRKIKLKILNARMSENSFNKWYQFNSFSKELFKLIDECYVQDKYSESRYSKLGVKTILRIPNIKFLTKKPAFSKLEFSKFNTILKEKFVITIFSTHEGEEKMIIESLDYLITNKKNLFIIIIPRHIKRTHSIEKILRKRKISYALRSKFIKYSKNKKVLLVDSFGELPLFFKLSKIAIVGGSFLNKGGQNPIEASFFNCSVIFGPFMSNFSDISKKMLDYDAGFQVNDRNELNKKILLLSNNTKLRIKTSKNFKKLCNNQNLLSSKIFNKILD